MKSIGIFYFSGTGNTELTAEMLQEEFLRLGCKVVLFPIEDVLKNNLEVNMKEYDMVGIGSPVIGYGAPKIVFDFIQKLPKATDKQVFIFRTAGGVAPVNYNASKSMIRRLRKKGYITFYERVFSIGSNWVVKFRDDIMRQLYEATKRKVSIMCQEVLEGKGRILETSLGLKVVMEFTSTISFYLLRLVGKDYAISKGCSRCGACIKNCPSKNIYEKKGKIKFGFNCNSCMRCYYACPKNAIRFRFFGFFPVKGGYDIRKLLTQPAFEDDKNNGITPPFFDSYIKDDFIS